MSFPFTTSICIVSCSVSSIIATLHLHLIFFFFSSGALRRLHSFPTRRSSDLVAFRLAAETDRLAACAPQTNYPTPRSEEHTSELQSRGHLVCRLLLEKKKKCHPTERTLRVRR